MNYNAIMTIHINVIILLSSLPSFKQQLVMKSKKIHLDIIKIFAMTKDKKKNERNWYPRVFYDLKQL